MSNDDPSYESDRSPQAVTRILRSKGFESGQLVYISTAQFGLGDVKFSLFSSTARKKHFSIPVSLDGEMHRVVVTSLKADYDAKYREGKTNHHNWMIEGWLLETGDEPWDEGVVRVRCYFRPADPGPVVEAQRIPTNPNPHGRIVYTNS